ncbi:MAG: FG-GAP-like repeat-containing protein [Candidatus Cloacimonetes bacterium]|nr:FG-GAP-like repeat-containing protein [Candidatus Cloacimonadota bacterium]
MKTLTLFIIFILCVSLFSSVDELLFENCQSISDWTITTHSGNTLSNPWRNTGCAGTLNNSSGNFLWSDGYQAGYDDWYQVSATINSPIIDCTEYERVELSFTHYYNQGSYDDDEGRVKVSSPLNSYYQWTYATYDAETPDGQSVSMNISGRAGGRNNVRVHFYFDSPCYWYFGYGHWYIDNIKVIGYKIDEEPGTCLNFDGSNDYAQINSNVIPASGDFTVEVWAKANSTQTGYREIISQNAGTGGEDFYIGRASNGTIRAGDHWTNTGVQFPTDNQWHHYCIVKNSSNTYFYFDGELRATRGFSITNPAGTEFRLARQYGSHSEYFQGSIDELRIWSVARSEQQIQEKLHLVLDGDETGLEAYFQFHEETGSIIHSVTSYLDGTLYNMDSSDWITSDLPIGGGYSYTHNISTTGNYDFGSTNVTMDMNTISDPLTFVATKLYNTPNLVPNYENAFNDNYWIINAYGTGTYETDLNIDIDGDFTSDDETYPDKIKLFKRDSNSNGDWQFINNAYAIDSTSETATFDSITDFSQLIIERADNELVADTISPQDDEIDVLNDTDLIITFNQKTFAGSGNVAIYNAENDELVESIPATSTSIMNNTVTISLTNNLYFENEFYIQIDADAFLDEFGNYFNGYDDQTSWNFTTTIVGLFTDISAGFEAVSEGHCIWGDYNLDGYLDALITGKNIDPSTTLYQNNSGTMINSGIVFTDVYQSCLQWGDFDGDLDLDLLMTGLDSSDLAVTKLYVNISGSFAELPTNIPDIGNGSCDWGDYDNDGDLDILISGWDNTTIYTKIFENDNGTFTDVFSNLPAVYKSYVKFIDYDNDSDLDVFLSGEDSSNLITDIFQNNDGEFTCMNFGFTQFTNTACDWGDFDSDGDWDLIIAGNIIGGSYSTKIYENVNNSFLEYGIGSITDIQNGDVKWGDYDNDGDLDILLTGDSGSGSISNLYKNKNGTFAEINVGLEGLSFSSTQWGDYDNDGGLDILCSGLGSSGNVFTVYQNNTLHTNTPPTTPTGFTAEQFRNGDASISWNPATDNETPVDGLSYYLFIKDMFTGNYIVPAHSLPWDDVHLIPEFGNVGKNTSYIIKNLPFSSFKCGIYTIDSAFQISQCEYAYFYTAPKPDSPQNLVITKIGNDSQLTWDSVDDPEYEIDYNVYSSLDPNSIFPDEWILVVESINETNYTDTNVAGEKLFYRVVSNTKETPWK